MDCTGELKADGLQLYQELIGSLRFAVEISRVDILLETVILSKHLDLPCEGHLEQVLYIVGYLRRRKKIRLLFNSGYSTNNEKFSRNMIHLTSIGMQRRPLVSLSHVLWMLTMEGI